VAIFHLKADVICRSHGRSVVAAAAYRAGQILRDERQGITFNFSRRRHVAWAEIMAPVGAPKWVNDRLQLWNVVERQERRRDSQLAREVLIALPHELSRAQQIALVKHFVRREFVSHGLVVDMCVHENPTNVHAHLLVSMRRLEGEGFGNKCRELNSRDYLKNMRERWARSVNAFLMVDGHEARVDHRRRSIHEASTSTSSITPKEKSMTTHNATQSPVEQRPKPGPFTWGSTRGPQPGVKPITFNGVQCFGDEVRPELFDHLEECLREVLRRIYPGEVQVTYDAKLGVYTAHHEGIEVAKVTKDKIVCASDSDDAVRLCVEAAIELGWKRIRFHGSEDFRRRAYEEALRRGYGPADIDGYSPPSNGLALVPTSTSQENLGFTKRIRLQTPR
jgi:hypothetical protein